MMGPLDWAYLGHLMMAAVPDETEARRMVREASPGWADQVEAANAEAERLDDQAHPGPRLSVPADHQAEAAMRGQALRVHGRAARRRHGRLPARRASSTRARCLPPPRSRRVYCHHCVQAPHPARAHASAGAHVRPMRPDQVAAGSGSSRQWLARLPSAWARASRACPGLPRLPMSSGRVEDDG